MPKQQHSTSEKHKDRQRGWRGEEKRTEQAQAKLPPWKLLPLTDPNLARSVNVEQRAALMQAGQQVLGNQVVQRLLHPEAIQGRPLSEQTSLPAQEQVDEGEETLQAEELTGERQEATAAPVETAPEPNVQGSMMGQEVMLGPGPHSWETIAATGRGFTYAYAGENDLSGVEAGLAGTWGGDFTYEGVGEKKTKGANAQWKITSRKIKAGLEKKEGLWFEVLERFDAHAEYWLNSEAYWDPIRYFPGGSWVAHFSTREGSEIHEVAEIEEAKKHWEITEAKIKAGTDKGFATKREARRNARAVSSEAMNYYNEKYFGIISHRIPVGPKKEWDHYRKEFAKYKADRSQRQELLKSFPRAIDLATSLEDFENAFAGTDYEGRMSAANMAAAKAKALGDKERQLIREDIRESGVFEPGTWYHKVHFPLLMIHREIGVLLEPGMGYGVPSGYMDSLQQLQTELGGLEVSPRYVWGLKQE